ncbi:hypothetical protein [Methylorubrum thiocyanatum]|uniref:hypothetical protein n=1 Tax=Methylorubrum thiocyanatum TaxID=47958 RepID=UPI003F7D2FD6
MHLGSRGPDIDRRGLFRNRSHQRTNGIIIALRQDKANEIEEILMIPHWSRSEIWCGTEWFHG